MILGMMPKLSRIFELLSIGYVMECLHQCIHSGFRLNLVYTVINWCPSSCTRNPVICVNCEKIAWCSNCGITNVSLAKLPAEKVQCRISEADRPILNKTIKLEITNYK